ncbi:hypothetical protein NBRC10513v2_007786 [Rhodotorula toruloides]|uniref:BY PROTMAP: gi/472583799/gb/EMS21423.1/ epidermal growth factor receptor substrate 15 [Rhodosporidium toruloides NP11] gi/647402217/emb/CDR48498.1/ RHTO0S18e01376g1_1 [Rhodosporidium toruloides] n=1 Tax=Rhodotorula toruloides TaxID=5286 RepID=A0A0K3CD12_RHOTO|nr:hypothetical protein AAT19DRAFT_13594 [Rhodotorula toruloides]
MASEPLPAQLSAYKPSKHERDAYNYLFDKADTQQLGVLTGDLAVPFFSHSSLPPLILGEVWQIADPDNSGFLSPERFGVACRLIGHAQERNRRGAPEVKTEDVGKAGPLPTFQGYALPAHLSHPPPSSTSSSSALSPPTSPSPAPAPARQSSLPPSNPNLTTISPTDKANYTRIFSAANGGSVGGLLDGDKAREIWVKSGLPYDVLGQIWTLADTHSRGALDLTDFTIGMHLLHLVLDGSLPRSVSGLPKVLDPKMYAAAAGLPLPGQGAPTPSTPSAAPTPTPAPAPAQGGQGWAITPAEKSESDTWFSQLDTQNRGILEGDQAVGFFGQSGLDVGKLARIWDLADFENKGFLTKDTFAVAMHLVKKAVADPSFVLPDSLPDHLRPPTSLSATAGGAGGSHVQRDLLDLMDDEDGAPSTPTAAPSFASQPQPQRSLSPQLTGQRTTIPPPIQATMQPLPLSPQGTGQPQRSLSPQATGGSARGVGMVSSPLATSAPRGGFGDNFAPASSPAPQQQQQQQTSSNFFDENDDADLAATASSLASRASSLRTEHAAVSKDLESTSTSRAELESQVQAHNKEIESLQSQVSSAREAFETERTRVEELRARRDEQKRVLDRARHELISAQSDLSGLRMEKTEIEGEVLRDKEEVREVKRQVAMVEEEKRILSAEIERVRKEVRREKGLGAIARKQLASVEADRSRLEGELERARAGHVEGEGEEEKGIVTAKDEAALAATAPTAPAAHAAAVPLPATPAAVVSPAASTKSTNPFDRFTQPQQGLSPRPTGGSAKSTNPFASFGTRAQPQERAAETPQPKEEEQTSLPAAAAAAIGTGALAALGAAGAGIAHAVGVGKSDDEEKKEVEHGDEAEKNPFGIPSTAETKDARDDGFGDDFAASSAQPSAGGFEDDAFNVTPTATTAPTGADDGFENEFKAFDASAPADSSVPEPVEGTLGEIDSSAGFTDAVRDLNEGKGPDAVEGTLGEVDKDAGFDEAFKEVEEHHHAPSAEHEATEALPKLDKGKERAIEDDVFGEGGVGTSTPPRVDYDSDSGEDEAEGPEEAFGSTRPQQRDIESSADESGFATPAAASTDLGASSVADIAAVTGAASLPDDAEAGPTSELASRGAGEQARTNDSSESGESYVHVDVGPTGTAESVDMLEPPAPASFQPASPAVTPTQRRAAPPPPQRSAAAVSTPPVVPAFPGDADKGIAPVGIDVDQPVSKPEDDFESAFADMSVSSPPGASSINAPTATIQPDFDSFDNDFDFQPSFDEAEAVSAAQTAHNLAAVQSEVAPTDFDDAAFADFDSTFANNPSQAPSQAQASKSADGFDSAFDDSFGVSSPSTGSAAAPAITTGEGAEGGIPALGAPLGPAATASPVPQYAPPPGPPPPPKHHSTATAGDEDSDAVKTIKSMGFSREQAIEALEKYDYDVNRAVNSLVG